MDVGWDREMEKSGTRALHTAQGKKGKKHIVPCFFFCFCLRVRVPLLLGVFFTS